MNQTRLEQDITMKINNLREAAATLQTEVEAHDQKDVIIKLQQKRETVSLFWNGLIAFLRDHDLLDCFYDTESQQCFDETPGISSYPSLTAISFLTLDDKRVRLPYAQFDNPRSQVTSDFHIIARFLLFVEETILEQLLVTKGNHVATN